jgi:hypothetical protein
MDPRPGSTVIKVIQEHKFAVEETAEAEVPVVYEKVAPHDAAMTEIHVAIKIAPNPAVTVEPAAINIALTVEEGTSMPQIVAIKPSKLPALVPSNVTVSALLIEERAALPRWAARHAAEVRRTGRAVRHHRWSAAAHTATATADVGAHTASTTAATTTMMTLRVSTARKDER